MACSKKMRKYKVFYKGRYYGTFESPNKASKQTQMGFLGAGRSAICLLFEEYPHEDLFEVVITPVDCADPEIRRYCRCQKIKDKDGVRSFNMWSCALHSGWEKRDYF
jgi:hypothetical protein